MTATQSSREKHIPVLQAEVLTSLNPQKNEIFVDGTFGAGGYSRAILESCDCKVIAIDRDPTAIKNGKALVQAFSSQLTLLEGRFSDMGALLAGQKIDQVDGITLDVGVSSMQIDEAERGFSFLRDGPLDMRMSKSGPSAADVVNSYAESELVKIFRELGEEKHAGLIARAICQDRVNKPFERTLELANLIERLLRFDNKTNKRSRSGGKKSIHPATRVFQALRIYVNDELGELDAALDASIRLLRENGRLAIVSFHSLEDRRVKSFLAKHSGSMPNVSRHVPKMGESAPIYFELLKRGAIKPTIDEMNRNPRARSARLRVARRTATAMLEDCA